jgi:hypothetical protein
MDDATLARAALQKQQRGERPTREERGALRRVQRSRDDELRREHFATVRKGEWQRWSGRQQKVLNEQAARYGIPIGGAEISLPDVARWLHDFLAKNAHKLAAGDADDPAMAGVASPGLERYRLAHAERERLALARELAQTIVRRDLREGHARIASVLRKANEALLRQFGAAAQKLLNDALDDAEREVARLWPADDAGAA